MLHLPRGPQDWVIESPIVIGQSACPCCGDAWGYSRKPTEDEIRMMRHVLESSSAYAERMRLLLTHVRDQWEIRD